MSMPTIPDITPDIDISFDEAVNLLLTSIAMEEISLSKLMDAETDKIKYVVEKQKCKKSDIDDVLSVNSSVNSTIINMIKLQMLLQFKLENVERMIPKQHPCPPEPPCPPHPCPPCPPPHKHCCGLYGRSSGCVWNECDAFANAKATLRAFVFTGPNTNDNLLVYTVENDDVSLRMKAYSNDLCIQCCSECDQNRIAITGKGEAVKKSKCNTETLKCVNFQLKFWDDSPCKKGFHMNICSDSEHKLIHDSGFIAVKDSDRELKIVRN